MDNLKKEIRQALLGDLVPDEKRLAVSGQNRVIFRNGLRDGFGSVLFFGVLKKRRWFYVNKKAKNIEERCLKTMQDMGRMLNLKELESGEGVYISYLLGIPTILTYTCIKDKLTATAYSGRSLFGLIAVYRALFTFETALSEELSRFASETEKDLKRKEKEEAKEEKKARKMAKKQNKKAGKKKEDVKEDNKEDVKEDVDADVKEDIKETTEDAKNQA